MVLSALLLGGCGAGGAQGEAPVPVLSSSPEAQEAFRVLVGRFSLGTPEGRLAMEKELSAFVDRFPNDQQSRLAAALLAWVAMERGSFQRALSLARRVQGQGAGTAHDLAATVEGAVLRRQGAAEAALLKLRPLVSKLIDDYARMFFNEEIVSAALSSRHYALSLNLMSVWLREAALNQRGYVRGRIAAMLTDVPTAAILSALERRIAAGSGEGTAEHEYQTLLAERLAAIALKERDAKLAQELLSKAGPLLGDKGEAVAELSAGVTKARVEAPTVGLLLSLRTAAVRRRGAELSAGVMVGLGLPGSGARLVSRDDGGTAEGIDAALQSLSAEGAAILIAGLDGVDAERAASFAKAQGIPVVLATPPRSALDPKGFVFVTGPDPAEVRAGLVEALKNRGTGEAALIAEKPAGGEVIDVGTTIPGAAMFADVHFCEEPLDFPAWKNLSVGAVVIDADVECQRWAIASIAGRKLRMAFGFEALGEGLPVGSLVAAAGRYPVVAQAMTSPWLKPWLRYRAKAPSFWAGLGHDAAVLSWMGVRSLPAKGTEDPKEVAERRKAALSSLESAKGELWTTHASGFEGRRRLSRMLVPQEITRSSERRGPLASSP